MPSDDGDQPRLPERDQGARRNGRRFIGLLRPGDAFEELDALVSAGQAGGDGS